MCMMDISLRNGLKLVKLRLKLNIVFYPAIALGLGKYTNFLNISNLLNGKIFVEKKMFYLLFLFSFFYVCCYQKMFSEMS